MDLIWIRPGYQAALERAEESSSQLYREREDCRRDLEALELRHCQVLRKLEEARDAGDLSQVRLCGWGDIAIHRQPA